jgi:hypothetical protein
VPDILVINRLPLNRVPYRSWLGGDARLRMIASRDAMTADPAADSVHVVADYDCGRVEELAVALYRERPYDSIIALSEYDIIRAARLRGFLGVTGQSYESAIAFRDKVSMKDCWAASGVPVTPYAALETATDLLEFSGEHGFPVVVKPRRGAGSRSVSVLHDAADLSKWLDQVWSMPLTGISGWMAEKFVAGEMLHVDGIIRSGELEICWPSTITSLLEFHRRDPTISVLLDARDPVTARARSAVAAALRALPAPEFAIFHAELWRRPDGSLVLNEIASRIGGGKIRATIAAAFGTDMLQRFVLGSAYPERLGEQVPAAVPARAAGFVLIPPGSGTVGTVPGLPRRFQSGGFVEAAVTAQPGQVFAGAASSIESVAACVAAGSARPEVRSLLDSFAEWSLDAISFSS